MRQTIISVTIGLLLTIALVRESRWRGKMEVIAEKNHQLEKQLGAIHKDIEDTKGAIQLLRQERVLGVTVSPSSPDESELDTSMDPKEHSEIGGLSSSSAPSVSRAPLDTRVASIEAELEQMMKLKEQFLPVVSGGDRTYPEYDPTKPYTAEPVVDVADSSPPVPTKRGWGEEQAVGPPDTFEAGDRPSAWASLLPDGGEEWLSTGFDAPVDIAEIRIRETYNPGAITKVTAFVNGSEQVIWEGTSQSGPAPRDFVVRPDFGVTSDAIAIHMDTGLVKGWNEIDAVQMIDRAGNGHWATSAEASSTFAQQVPAFQGTPIDQPAP